MLDSTNASRSAMNSNVTQQNPLTDIYKNPLGSSPMPSSSNFSCTPGQFGCIPNPTQPNTGTWGQMTPQTGIPQTSINPATYDVQYLNQFLATQIGRLVTIEFLIGTNTFTDKSGTLLAVGTNYILLRETNSDDVVACDFYNIKFVKFYL